MTFHIDRHGGRDSVAVDGVAETPATDADLIEAAQALDEDAWAEIYRRHAREVYAYIYHRLGDQHVAEDLAADVFVRALAGIKGYTWRGTPLLAWLYRIAHNITIDYRKSAVRRSLQTTELDAEQIADHRADLLEIDEHADMMQAIGELTDDQQQVIILRFYQSLSTAEVAIVMNKPEGAVKALQGRGLRSLQRNLMERRMSA